MENQMKYYSMLSLKDIVFRKMVIDLWTELDILASVMKFYHESREVFGDDSEKWSEVVESKVTDKVSKLTLPESMTKQMLLIVKPVGLQIRRWAEFHERYLNSLLTDFGVHILEKLRWTSSGLVDYCKTAEQLIRCEMIDTVKRYQLACLYCLDDYIPIFWEELPEEIKRVFYNEQYTLLTHKPLMQFCWPYILKGEKSKLDYLPKRIVYGVVPTTFYQYAFEYSALRSNKAAAKYFLQKLTEEEREASLIRSTLAIISSHNLQYYKYSDEFPKEEMTGVLCYLLSQMNHEQQMEVFKEKPSEILCCYLNWPWQELFLKIADIVRAFLPGRDHTELLLSMLFNSKGSNKYFSSLFREFFTCSPVDFRKQFVALESKLGSSSFIKNFYDVQDLETIEVIFRNLDTADRLRLVSSEHFCKLSYAAILQGKEHMVEVCLLEATLSKEDRETLMLSFKVFMPRTYREEFKRREFLDALFSQEPTSEKDWKSLEDICRQSNPSYSEGEFRTSVGRAIQTNKQVLKRFHQILDKCSKQEKLGKGD